jgi:hypothetical protein
MDIHKPKPWHGLREFLKEYVIIVVGVLTALGAEQGVEWLHWQHEVQSARTTLKPEYLRIVRIGGERAGQSPCIGARIDAISGILDKAAETGRLPAIGPIDQPSRKAWSIRGWEALVSGQVLAHIPERERLVESSMAIRLDYAAHVRDEELTQWAVLGTLMGPGRKLQPGEIATYRSALGIAARNAGIMRVTVDSLPSDISLTGVVTHAEVAKAWQTGVDEGRHWLLCSALGTIPTSLSAAQGVLDRPAGPAIFSTPTVADKAPPARNP